MTRIIAIANQKGGVGKTTTTINLAAGLAEMGVVVLVVDLDPQGNASTGLGIKQSDRRLTSYDVMVDAMNPALAISPTLFENISIIPANADLASTDVAIALHKRRSFILSDALRGVGLAGKNIDMILIDCPPSLNLLTINALVACNAVLVPLQSEFFALEGLSHLLKTVREIREAANPDLRIEGVVLTMHDRRNNLTQLVEADVRKSLGSLVFKTVIPRNVRVSEAPSYEMPVLFYDSTSKGSEAYRALAREIADRYNLGIPRKEVCDP